MKKRNVRIVVLTIMLTFCMTIPTNADTASFSKVTETIDAPLQTILEDAVANEKIPVDIWLYEISTSQEREQKIYSKIGVNKAQIVAATKNTISAETIDEYIAAERALYAAERKQQYAALKLEYSDIDGLQETQKDNTRLFYSQYAPMISAELTREEIKRLARDVRVQAIYYSPDMPLESEGNISVPLINADYTRDTLGYTGSGIKIGLIEANGLPDRNKSYFIADNIEYDPSVNHSLFDDHADNVAAIMIAQPQTIGGVTYEGIVPDAKLYATYYSIVDWRARVEWLISKQVHVINMSAGSAAASDNVYGSDELWLDHVAVQHNIHFVKSAGNSNGYISRPGMAYNIMTVGAINDRNTLQHTDDIRYDLLQNNVNYGSSYIDHEELANKPDLVAPGVFVDSAAYLDGSSYANHGTSIATPHVTAVVAQLCQRFPSLRVNQAGVKAILTASICHSEFAYDGGISDSSNYDMFGAGMVDARAAFETVNAYRMIAQSFPANDTPHSEKVYTFSATVGQRIRVSLSWQKYVTLPDTVSHSSFNPIDSNLANLALYMIDPEGLWINCSNSFYDNTEIVDFIAEKSGTYKMVIVNQTPSECIVNFGLSWWFGAIVDSD